MTTPSLLTPDAATPTNLASVELTTAYAAVITAASNTAVKIGAAVICNITGGNINVTIGICPNAVTPGDTQAVVFDYPLAAGDSLPLWDYLGDQYLGEGDSVIAKASANNAVVFSATGVVFS